jgi:hypothetical protein
MQQLLELLQCSIPAKFGDAAPNAAVAMDSLILLSLAFLSSSTAHALSFSPCFSSRAAVDERYGCKRGGLRLPAPRPHKPRAQLRADAAARMPPLALCGRQRQPAFSRKQDASPGCAGP